MAAILGATFLLLLPTLWNGYVWVYYDSVDYLRIAFGGPVPVFRTAPYAVMLAAGRLVGSQWTVAVVQSLIASYVLHEALKVFAPFPPAKGLVPLVAALVLLTGLPWYTGQLMADAFTGLVVLGIATLAFERDRLGSRRRWVLVAMVALGIAVHTTHIPLAAGLVLCLLITARVSRHLWPALRPHVGAAAVALAIALAVVPLVHLTVSGRAFISQPHAVLFLARLVQDGIAKRYLDEVCPKGAGLKLCPLRGRLPGMSANNFLWGERIVYRLGGWEAMRPEAEKIIVETLLRYPLAHVRSAFALTGQQLVMVGTGDGLVPMQWLFGESMNRLEPDEAEDFEDAEQQHQPNGIDFAPINMIHVPALLTMTVACIVLLGLAWRRRDHLTVGLAGAVLLALLGNAFVCGALSNPNHRYQSRLAWTTLVVVAVGLTRLTQTRRRDDQPVKIEAGASFIPANR